MELRVAHHSEQHALRAHGGQPDAIAALYSEAGVERYVVWAHESDRAGPAELERRAYCVDTWTRAMGMSLDSVRVLHSEIDVATAGWRDYVNKAAERGCKTASLQATAMAERIYAAVGFRDLGASSSTCRGR